MNSSSRTVRLPEMAYERLEVLLGDLGEMSNAYSRIHFCPAVSCIGCFSVWP